jgi:hypothetical protein
MAFLVRFALPWPFCMPTGWYCFECSSNMGVLFTVGYSCAVTLPFFLFSFFIFFFVLLFGENYQKKKQTKKKIEAFPGLCTEFLL